MRTLLINPPPIDGERFIREGRCMQSVDSWAAIWPPLSLGILASLARRHGDVDLFDANVLDGYDVDKTVERAVAFEPDVIVVNTSFPSIEGDAACAQALKHACPRATVAGFGVFFSLLDEQALSACPGFDVGITGEPEPTFDELLHRLAAGTPLDGMAGLLRRQDGAVIKGPARPVVDDLDTLPFAARDLFRNDAYTLPHNGRPFTLINVSRGCPYPCIYCIAPVYYGKKIRRHSLEYVMRELEECQTKHGIDQFLFWEEVFTLDREFGMALCDAILERHWKISWATTTRADRVDLQILRKMKAAGCDLLGLGIESGVQEILDTARKKETVTDIEEAVVLCRHAGIRTMGHFIFGLPGETEETVQKTIEFGLSLGLDYIQCYAAVPYPKTELGEMAREKGWLMSDRWMEFDFGGSSRMNVGTIRPEQVDAAREELFRRFYLRPATIMRQAALLARHPGQVGQALSFLKWMRTRS
jgi:anaerobic magnesium-protoporphyrin IX monomethyl ester cyclase